MNYLKYSSISETKTPKKANSSAVRPSNKRPITQPEETAFSSTLFPFPNKRKKNNPLDSTLHFKGSIGAKTKCIILAQGIHMPSMSPINIIFLIVFTNKYLAPYLEQSPKGKKGKTFPRRQKIHRSQIEKIMHFQSKF